MANNPYYLADIARRAMQGDDVAYDMLETFTDEEVRADGMADYVLMCRDALEITG